MSDKNGPIIELVASTRYYFIEDGTNIGTVPLPVLTGRTVAPATIAAFADYSLGRVKSSDFKTKTKPRTIEYGDVTSGGYVEDEKELTIAEIYSFKTVDVATKIYNRIRFGTSSELVAATPQSAYVKRNRQLAGWAHKITVNDDGSRITSEIFRARLTVKDFPSDSSGQSEVSWEIRVLRDADPALTTVESNPA
jgi:hypothetical protein